MRFPTDLTIVDSIKAVIEDNLKEDKDEFIERTAVTLKKDFFHELYKELSYDVHDSSGKNCSSLRLDKAFSSLSQENLEKDTIFKPSKQLI